LTGKNESHCKMPLRPVHGAIFISSQLPSCGNRSKFPRDFDQNTRGGGEYTATCGRGSPYFFFFQPTSWRRSPSTDSVLGAQTTSTYCACTHLLRHLFICI
jgi:hypothetical protein